MDPFVSALEELAEALLAGEDPEQVLSDIAEENSLPIQALSNRALRAFGPLETYKLRQAELKKEREQTAVKLTDLPDLGVITTAAEVLDLLLLVFIVVELLYAVRTTLAERELLAEPFLLVGIIASIKEIVVLSVKAADEIGTGTAFSDAMWEVAILGVLVLLLGATALLLRRKEREPGEGDDQGPFQADQAGDPPG